MQSNLPFLTQIAEEDLTSASTSVTSFHLPTSLTRRHQPAIVPANRALSDQDLFTHVDNQYNPNPDVPLSTMKPTSYAHFHFDQSSKQLAKGNSLVSVSSDSVDLSLNPNETNNARRRVYPTSPVSESTMDLPSKVNGNNSKVNLRKQTQDIAARAAQRRASRHHKELMDDISARQINVSND
jgi:hypothetical protein